MKNYWYPLLFTRSLPQERPHSDSLFGDPVVLFRDRRGQVRCLADLEVPRSPLSLDQLGDGSLDYSYHGWRFDHEGTVAHVPTHAPPDPVPKGVGGRSYPVIERAGMIWVWPGKPAAADLALMPTPNKVVPAGWAMVDLALDWNMDPDLALEIILDQAHVPFANVSGAETPEQGPAVDLVLYQRTSGFQGCCRYPNREVKYPLWITFTRPSTVRIDFLTKRAGPLLEERLPPSGSRLEETLIEEDWIFLVELFHVVPIAPGKTRVLTRTLRNWATGIPFMDLWMRRLVKRTMTQDLAVLAALQLHCEQGANPWSRPVRADGLALAYRRWRSGIETAQRLD